MNKYRDARRTDLDNKPDERAVWHDQNCQTERVSARSLLAALSTSSIWPAFQPLVDLQTNTIIGFEVLARWTDVEKGNIPPSEFIMVAEDSDLIDTLTRKIVTESCYQAAAWPGTFVLAINISPVQFRDPDLFSFLVGTIEPTGFPLHRITIEITESALLEDDETVRSTIEKLKTVGIGLALDDFGTVLPVSRACMHSPSIN